MNIAATATPTLSAQLWQRSKALHVQAERSGIIARILRGTASKAGYTLLMHNLLPAYRALEAGEAAGVWDFEEAHCGHAIA